MADTKDHEFNPDAYPPFPSNVPVAQLETFKFDTLHADGKSLNGQTLRSACYHHGVFYISLADSESFYNNIPERAKDVMHLLEPIFNLPQMKKDKFISSDLVSKVGGYQRAGASVVDEKNAPEFPEIFNIPKNDIKDYYRVPGALSSALVQGLWPSVILKHGNWKKIMWFMSACHEICMKVLNVLSIQAGLPVGASLRQLHQFSLPSSDILRVIRGPARCSRADDNTAADEEGAAEEGAAEDAAAEDEEDVHMLLHRDMGTITILFNWLGGLQVKDRDTGTLMWVEPKAGHAVVIVGKALAYFLDGQDDGTLGAWHRLVAAPGPEQGKFARYSLGYFVRPEDDVLLKKATAIPDSDVLCKMRRTGWRFRRESEEEIPTAKEWIVMKQAKRLGQGEGVARWEEEIDAEEGEEMERP
ncbi:hypothetical protein LTR55_009432 [Exophiala xenobiotica]|nr:hypothetical protein LTR14_009375 [Exophiala xenobiotica]KAK5475428.1 hypothetical protein LTR55_009432 [Exophiala xenobiotica]